jgi:hypothetical protein
MAEEDGREETSISTTGGGGEESRRRDDDPIRQLRLQLERAADVHEELDALVRDECEEIEEQRPVGPDWESIITCQRVGTFHILTARRGDELVGYLSWMLDFDMESYGTLIAHQCAWYVKPGQFKVAVKMFDWLIDELRRIGVKFAYLSHSATGRGQTLGKFFERRGATHKSTIYALKLGKDGD